MTTDTQGGEPSTEELAMTNAIHAAIHALSTFEVAARVQVLARAPFDGAPEETDLKFRGEVVRVAQEALSYREAAYQLAVGHICGVMWGEAPRSLAALERVARAAYVAFDSVAPPTAPVEDAFERLPVVLAQLGTLAQEYTSTFEELKALDLAPEEMQEILSRTDEVAMYSTVLARVLAPSAPTPHTPRALHLARDVVNFHRSVAPMIPQKVLDLVTPQQRKHDPPSRAERWKAQVRLAEWLRAEVPDTPLASTLFPWAVFVELAFSFGAHPGRARGGRSHGVFLGALELFIDEHTDSTRERCHSAESVVNHALRCLGHEPGSMSSGRRKEVQRGRDAENPDRTRQSNGRGKGKGRRTH